MIFSSYNTLFKISQIMFQLFKGITKNIVFKKISSLNRMISQENVLFHSIIVDSAIVTLIYLYHKWTGTLFCSVGTQIVEERTRLFRNLGVCVCVYTEENGGKQIKIRLDHDPSNAPRRMEGQKTISEINVRAYDYFVDN